MFAKFRSVNFSLEDEDQMYLHSIDDEPIKASLEENPALSVEKMAMKLCSNYTLVNVIFNNLEKFLNLKNWCIWNFHNSTANLKLISFLHYCKLISPLWYRLVTDDKKWKFIKILDVIESSLVMKKDPITTKRGILCGESSFIILVGLQRNNSLQVATN